MTAHVDPVGTVEGWWPQLRAAALVGTARRDVPALPVELGVSTRAESAREDRLLDAAALGDAVRRAGRRLGAARPEDIGPSPHETRPVAGDRATQVLELLLHQGPVGAGPRRELTRHWLVTAATAGRIVPPRLLPTLLTLASAQRDQDLRPVVGAVLGERGRWLAALNPEWEWALADVRPADEDDAGPAPTEDRTEMVARIRRDDPAAGLDAVLADWSTTDARTRAAGVAGLVVGLGADDAAFLEDCLDDRAKGVREQALALLDHLPDSPRGARMAARLRPLLSVTGTLRKTIRIELPDEPDAAARRDGLVDVRAPGSQRARWLGQIVRGAPLSVWTDLVQGDPRTVVSRLRGEDGADVLAALRATAAVREDVDWARALLPGGWNGHLLQVLPTSERESLLAERIASAGLGETVPDLVRHPSPWGADLSAAVVRAAGRSEQAGHAVRILRDVLPGALHPSTSAAVERLMNGAGDDSVLRTTFRDVLQHQSLSRSISEAFS